MDRLEEIKKKMYCYKNDRDWLISKIERLKKEKESLNVDYLREKKEKEKLFEVLYKIENIEASKEQLREIARKAIKIELTEGGG